MFSIYYFLQVTALHIIVPGHLNYNFRNCLLKIKKNRNLKQKRMEISKPVEEL